MTADPAACRWHRAARSAPTSSRSLSDRRADGVEIRRTALPRPDPACGCHPTDAGHRRGRAALGVRPAAARSPRRRDRGAYRLAIWTGPGRMARRRGRRRRRRSGVGRARRRPSARRRRPSTCRRIGRVLELRGPRVRDVLSAGCSDRPPSARRSPSATAVADPARPRRRHHRPRRRGHLPRRSSRTSFARYLVDWLQDAVEA